MCIVTFVGFDSAWAGNPKKPGAICAAVLDGNRTLRFHEPESATFCEGLERICSWESVDGPTLIGLDQPTIVENLTGGRPVEAVAASVISFLGGGVQPANKQRPFFRPDAPIWRFIENLGASHDPRIALTAKAGRHLIEVFPALALASYSENFFGSRSGPRYNPSRRKTFSLESWRAVAEAAIGEASRFKCEALATWLARAGSIQSPTKRDQDRLDAALCLLVVLRWRLGRTSESAMIGDLRSGYMVSPICEAVVDRLRYSASRRGVPFGFAE